MGVAAALRARLPASVSSAKVRCRNDRWSGLIAFVENSLPRRTGIAATLLLLVASTGLGIVKGGHLEAFVASVSETRNAIANSAGFRITSVAINGRKQLTQDEILAIGGVNGHSSLLFLDASSVREKLKADPWDQRLVVLETLSRPTPDRYRRAGAVRALAAQWPDVGGFGRWRGAGTLCFAAFPEAAAGGGQGSRDPRAGFPGSARPATRRSTP